MAQPTVRDPLIDTVRAASIAVVVLWHWVFSVTHWSDSRLTMPNPVDDIAGGWALTWVLQVMPLFFVCGGVANLSSRRRREPGSAFVARRLRGLLVPTATYLAFWIVLDAVLQLAFPGLGHVWTWGMVVFVPLWFLGVYVGVIAAAPVTMWLHDRAPLLTVAGLGGAIVVGEVLRFGHGVESVAMMTAALVWLLCHQLGYLWRDGLIAQRRWGVTAAGLAALTALTTWGPHPRSMVATEGAAISNLFPTTAAVAALAVFQTGLLAVVRSRLRPLLGRPRIGRAVALANGLAMPVFLWHMTALVAVIGVFHLAGGTLGTQPTPSWWSTRPLWLVGPGVVLACLLAALGQLSRRTASANASASA